MNTIGAINNYAPAMRSQTYDNAATYPQAYDSYNAYDTFETAQQPKKKGNAGTIILGLAAIVATIVAVVTKRNTGKLVNEAAEAAKKEVSEQVQKLSDDLAATTEHLDKYKDMSLWKRIWNVFRPSKYRNHNVTKTADDAVKAVEEAVEEVAEQAVK